MFKANGDLESQYNLGIESEILKHHEDKLTLESRLANYKHTLHNRPH